MIVYILMNGDGYYESVDNVFSTRELAVTRIKKLAESDLSELKQTSGNTFRNDYSVYRIVERVVICK